MPKRKATGTDLAKLWLAAAVVIGASIWVLSQSTVDCPTSITDGAGMGRCVGTSFAHSFAPAALWAIAFAAGMAILATVIYSLRRR
jgi:hypothetical protein